MIVDIYITYVNGSRLPYPVYSKEFMVSDQLHETIWSDVDSIEFLTFIHANLPRVSCQEHGISGVSLPCVELSSRFMVICETASKGMLQNIDTYNFTEIMILSWKQAWKPIERAVRRERKIKIGKPSLLT